MPRVPLIVVWPDHIQAGRRSDAMVSWVDLVPTLIDLAGPLFAILGAQFAVAIAINIFLVFPLMGKNYDAAVVSAGFGGISLGATPTAMANMAAVTQRYGPSHLAFIVVPLVCAFFIDLVNAQCGQSIGGQDMWDQ